MNFEETILATNPQYVSIMTVRGIRIARVGTSLWAFSRDEAEAIPDTNLPISYRSPGQSQQERFTRRPGGTFFHSETQCRECENWFFYSEVSDETGCCYQCDRELDDLFSRLTPFTPHDLICFLADCSGHVADDPAAEKVFQRLIANVLEADGVAA